MTRTDGAVAARWWGILAAALLAIGFYAGPVTPVQAAPSGSDSTVVDGPNGPIELVVSPVRGLPAAGAEITVSGSGFNAAGELWVAVCEDSGAAPESFTNCLGGSIPNVNASSAWAVISQDGQARYAGPVPGQFSGNGMFQVVLQVPGASGQDADCLASSCSVYTRSADSGDRSQDAAVSVRFEVPATGTALPTGTPSTEIIGGTATTAAPDSVSAPVIPAGGEQSVTFSGFSPGEAIEVTLYSDPISLPAAEADSTGTVSITFTVPPDLPLGEHLLQAVGVESGRVGVASFTVEAAEETTETSTTETVSTQTSAPPTSPAADTETAVTASVNESATEPALATDDDVAGDALSEGEAAAPTNSEPTNTGSGSVAWLWIVLAVVVIGGGGFAAAMVLRRRGQSGHGPGPGPAAPSEHGGQPGAYAAESAPDHEQAFPLWREEDGPESWEPATSADSGGEPGFADPPYSPSWGDLSAAQLPNDGGPRTEEWRPDFGPADDGGPPTEQWRPDFGEPPSEGRGRHHA